MKTINYVLTLLALVASTSASNAQTADKNFYVEGALVPMTVSGSDLSIKPIAARFTLGTNINNNLAVEGVYVATAKKDSIKVEDIDVDVAVSGYGMYLKPKMEVSKGTEVFGRIGYTSAKLTASAGRVSADSDRVNSLSYGAGVQTEIDKDWYAQADYMVFSKKDGGTAKGFGLSVGYRF